MFSKILVISSLLCQAKYLLLCDKNFYPDSKGPIKNYASLEDPFRMQKCNLLWNKARVKLAETKLEHLYSALKVQDKNELTLKKLKSEGNDKDGIKEDEMRKKFNNIMLSYGLGGTPEPKDAEPSGSWSKAIFKDKKLQRLWEKAEQAGLSSVELIALQEEFKHHQRKVDEYHRLLELADKSSDDYNEIKKKIEREEFDLRDTNEISKKGKDLKTNYDRLHRLATNQAEDNQFEEPKVAGLWKLALNSNFTLLELESIREELVHYQKRLEKMRFLERELQLVDDRQVGKDEDKTEGRKVMDRKLAKHVETVSKLHDSLEGKILARHNEL